MYKYLNCIATILICLVVTIVVHFTSESFLKRKQENDELMATYRLQQQFNKAEILFALGREKEAQDVLVDLALAIYSDSEFPAQALLKLAKKEDGTYDKHLIKIIVERFPKSETAKRAEIILKRMP